MVQTQNDAIGIDILEIVAIACFEKTPPNIYKVAAKFVVTVGGRYYDAVADGEQGRWGQLLVGLAIGVRYFEESFRTFCELVSAAEKGAVARLWGVEVILRLIIVRVTASIRGDSRPVEGTPACIWIAVVITGVLASRRNDRLPGFVALGAQAVNDVAFRGGRTAVFVIGAVVFSPVVVFVRYAETAVTGPDGLPVVVTGRKQYVAFFALQTGGYAEVADFAIAMRLKFPHSNLSLPLPYLTG